MIIGWKRTIGNWKLEIGNWKVKGEKLEVKSVITNQDALV
jgi:hypothetical protein